MVWTFRGSAPLMFLISKVNESGSSDDFLHGDHEWTTYGLPRHHRQPCPDVWQVIRVHGRLPAVMWRAVIGPLIVTMG